MSCIVSINIDLLLEKLYNNIVSFFERKEKKMNIVLPRDVRDLKIQIGTDILVTGMRQLGVSRDQIEMALIRANDVDHIEAAEKRREEFEEEFRQLGFIAERAYRELPATDNAIMSLLSDLYNYPEVQEFLRVHGFEYISILISGIAGHIESMEQILESLSAYGRGE